MQPQPQINSHPLESRLIQRNPFIRELERVWAHTLGDPRITIAVLDGPVDVLHPCLRGAALSLPARNEHSICRSHAACAHGLHVASQIFAQHGSGPLRGVAPRCRGLIIPIFQDPTDPATPLRPCGQADLARAIEAAVGSGANVINISAGQPGDRHDADPALRRAVELCRRRGVMLVAAAGNDGCDCQHLPAAMPGVLAVGASTRAGGAAAFSNFGASLRQTGVVAPGEELLGAAPGGGYVRQSGTSFATPLVSGLAALLLSARLQRRGHILPADVHSAAAAIRRAVRPCASNDPAMCRRLLIGRVDPWNSFQTFTKGDAAMREATAVAMSETVESAMAIESDAERVSPSCAGKENCSCGGAAPTLTPRESATEDGANDDEASPPLAAAPSAAARRAAPQTSRERGMSPAGCGCGDGGGGLVYALGELGYDFGTQARLDAIDVVMDDGKFATNPRDLHAFVTADANRHIAPAIIWTLNHDVTPIYAVRPEGPFARETYERLLHFFGEQLDGTSERVSIPGTLDGSVRLLSGQTVPVLIPDLRGMYNWTTRALVDTVLGDCPKGGKEKDDWERREEGMRGFLERIYYEVRNLGQTPQERALNFSATNAFNLEKVFESAAKKELSLDEIGVERSPICRPDSDCWDVRLTFFNPENAFNSGRSVYRFTVDVSDVVPVLVGPVRTWTVR